MANLLARVGRDPKTCATQIATFCSGNVAGTGKPGGDRGNNNRERLSRDSGATDYGISDDGEEKNPGKLRKGGGRSGKRGSRDVDDAEDAGRGRSRGRVGFAVPSTASLAEILAFFGFAFEATGLAVKPSVAEAFAMLRLHAQPTEVRVAGEAARRYTNTMVMFFFRDLHGSRGPGR